MGHWEDEVGENNPAARKLATANATDAGKKLGEYLSDLIVEDTRRRFRDRGSRRGGKANEGQVR